jgi:N-acetylglucosaminyl-diphospho-decaprenol L-rhamnosyltransferase
MQTTIPQLSVVIVSWNTLALLRTCLQSVFETLNSIDFEVFVVDNASTDLSVLMVASEFPTVRIIANQENVGFARANNQALRVAGGRYVLLLNPDTLLLEGSVAQCLAFMANNPNTGVVGGELLNADGSFQSGYFEFPTLRSQVRALTGREYRYYMRWKAQYSPIPAIRAVDWVGGAFMLVRAEAMKSVGLMDERFFMFSEETEWCYRIRRAGWNIHYLSGAKIIHYHQQSTKQVASIMNAHSVRSQLILFWTHYPRIQAVLITMLAFVLGVAFILKGLMSRRQAQVPFL